MKTGFLLFNLAILLPIAHIQAQTTRTEIDTELGAIYTQPNGFTHADLGAYVGVNTSENAAVLNPRAIKVVHSRFHIFRPSDDTSWSWFPYSALRQYESQQVAAGKPPIFITATYLGKKRPVLWRWSLKLANNKPTAPSQEWEYAVNVQDDRFIDFWLNRYVRPVLMKPLYATQNVWIGLDECAWMLSMYGVLDDNNNFISPVTWDAPFPQDETQYLTSINTFFQRLQQLAPDVRVIPNQGSMRDPSQFPAAYANIPGLMQENIFDVNPVGYTKNQRYPQFNNLIWYASQGRIMLIQSRVPPNDPVQLRTAFAEYLLIKGPNSFWAPASTSSSYTVPPSQYQAMKAHLGNPTGAMQSTQEPGLGVGYRLFWRTYDGGIVYLNWTGKAKTVTLPTNRPYYDASGNPVTSLTIPDATGTYATYSRLPKLAQPSISPRFASAVTSPFYVTIDPETPGAIVRYTMDGSAPTGTSPVYTGPLYLANNATIKAQAFLSGYNPSPVAAAQYTVSAATPFVQFHLASDSGPAGTYYPVLKLSAIPDGVVSVKYTVQQPNGTLTSGTATFLPNELYRHFPITVSGSVGQVANITISQPSNAVLGATTTLRYTIQ